MATQNITIDQNTSTNVDITDANAAADDKILMQFYQNDVNIFNLATENMGGASGEISITVGVKYIAAVTDKKALLLDPDATLTHKVYKFDTDNIPTELHDGSVTCTELSGGSPTQATLAYNNNRMYDRTITDVTGTLTEKDQIVYCVNAIGITLTLPDATTMPGKEFHIINLGSGDVEFDTNDGTTTLETGEHALIRARGTSETTPEADYIILITNGATA